MPMSIRKDAGKATHTRSSPDSSSGDESETNSISSSRVDVEENGSRKRRRLSPSGDADSESEPEEKPRALLPTATISRIKAKQNLKQNVTSKTTEHDDLPAAIRESIKGHENTSFSSINVDSWLVASLANMAIKNPTGIQRGCIPEILKGRDCIGGSRTGSGKTVAFAVPILQQWAKDPVGIFALVLTPTRYVLTIVKV